MVNVRLSVIILSYNTLELLRKCLESVPAPPGVEIIVVDNASTDGSPEMVAKEFPKAVLVANRKNLGFAGGNNLGIKIAKGEYLLFLNSDTVVKPGALSEAVDFMEKNPEVGAFSPKTLLANGQMDPDCHRGFPTPWASISYFLGLEKFFPKSKVFGQYHKFYLDLNHNHEIDAGAGAFMLIRREIVEKVGVWDDQYFFYGEDLDYFYRIKEAGFKIMFYARPLLTHLKGGSSGLRKESKKVTRASRETRLRVARESIRAMEIFYRKFYQNRYPSWLTFLVLTGIRLKGWGRYLKHYLKK